MCLIQEEFIVLSAIVTSMCVYWLAYLFFYNGVFREAFIDKALKNMWPLRGDESESSFPGIFAKK